ncbi:hypothetical protein KQI84_06750 [bacterium]|nr:hypothetical protein [bacterium]
MAKRTCFVIMPIGDQKYGDIAVTKEELRQKYDDLIKEAILKADPDLDVKRADDVAMPGCIGSDIVMRILHSDLVVADVSYPNPNVFYELGLRHACRIGTIIVREKSAPQIPFDLAHTRYIQYENTSTGLKQLAEELAQYMDHLERNPDQPDNQLLDQAKFTQYKFPDLGIHDEQETPPEVVILEKLFQSPDFLELFLKQASGEDVSQQDLMKAMIEDPDTSSIIIRTLAKTGQLSLGSSEGENKPVRKKAVPRRRKRN